MSKFGDYHGTIMRDEIKKKIVPYIKNHSRVAFIINTDPHNMPGKHWCAVYIDADGPESSNSLEWFNSFADPMPKDILWDCKLILKMLKPSTILKVKENRVVHQSDDSANCGFMAMKFLIDRFRGKSFAESSGYDDRIKINAINKDEKEIERLKNTAPFKYVY